MSEPEITVRKIEYATPISCCVLADSGGPPCDHPAPPRLPWRKRLRWAASWWWHSHRPRVHCGPCRCDCED